MKPSPCFSVKSATTLIHLCALCPGLFLMLAPRSPPFHLARAHTLPVDPAQTSSYF